MDNDELRRNQELAAINAVMARSQASGETREQKIAAIRAQRRYEIAKAVLAGFAADLDAWPDCTHGRFASVAVNWADALLAELDK